MSNRSFVQLHYRSVPCRCQQDFIKLPLLILKVCLFLCYTVPVTGGVPMPEANQTKQAFGDALKELLKTQPFEKVTVSSICEQANMKRTSFYYHFLDKYDLVNWIFDTEYEAFLKEAFSVESLEPKGVPKGVTRTSSRSPGRTRSSTTSESSSRPCCRRCCGTTTRTRRRWNSTSTSTAMPSWRPSSAG